MKGRGTKKLDQLKYLSLKIQEPTSKDNAITKKKENNMSDKSLNRRNCLQKLPRATPCTPCQRDFRVVENVFADDCK